MLPFGEIGIGGGARPVTVSDRLRRGMTARTGPLFGA